MQGIVLRIIDIQIRCGLIIRANYKIYYKFSLSLQSLFTNRKVISSSHECLKAKFQFTYKTEGQSTNMLTFENVKVIKKQRKSKK